MTSSVDIKPSYLVSYGSASNNQETEPKGNYNAYYSKFQEMKSDMKVPKTEVTTSSSCCNVVGRNDLLVPKTESQTSCRSPTNMRPVYDPYMSQDSNSSSMSSMEAMSSRGPHHQLQPISQHPSIPQYNLEDTRQHQMPHRSPYHQSPMSSDEMYRTDHQMRSYGDINDSMSGAIARPTVTYPSEMGPRPYDTSLTRPYDPGTTTAFERYDATNQCSNLPQSVMPQRPPQSIYGYLEEQQEQRYQQEAAVAAAQHQMAVANAAAAGMMKQEPDQQSAGPLYPR